MRKIRRVELDDSRGEGITAVGDDARGIGYIQHIPLTERVRLERNMKLLSELVVPGHPIPLKVVVAPGAVIDGISTNVDVVIGGIGLVAHAAGDPWARARSCQHGG